MDGKVNGSETPARKSICPMSFPTVVHWCLLVTVITVNSTMFFGGVTELQSCPGRDTGLKTKWPFLN